MSLHPKFKSKVCITCNQTENYLLALDRGTALFLLAMSHAVRRLGRNKVHLQKELEASLKEFGSVKEMVEAGYMYSAMVRNAPRARYHGLIAFVEREGGTGEYLITRKGAAFLHGTPAPRCAVINKTTKHNAGYWNEQHDTTTIFALLKESSTWIIPHFEIPAEGTYQPSLLPLNTYGKQA